MSWTRGLSRVLFKNDMTDDEDVDTAGSDFNSDYPNTGQGDISMDPECTESEPVFGSPEVRMAHRHTMTHNNNSSSHDNHYDGPSSPFKLLNESNRHAEICSSPTHLRDRVNDLHILSQTSPQTPNIRRKPFNRRLSARTPMRGILLNTVVKSGTVKRGVKRNLTPREVNVNPFSPNIIQYHRDVKKHKPSPLNGSFTTKDGSFIKDGSSESCPVMITDGEEESEVDVNVFDKSSSEPDAMGPSTASSELLHPHNGPSAASSLVKTSVTRVRSTTDMRGGDEELIPFFPRYVADFEEVEQLGSGESGSVFKCFNRLDGCVYAVKRSTKPAKMNSEFNKKSLIEVYAHAVLGKHRRIVRYYSAWAEDQIMYIQNEYCEGGSLSDLLEVMRTNDRNLSEYQLKKIVLHVSQGLRFIHSLNLAHMDIKPDNIFLSRKLDFETDKSGDFCDDGFIEDELDETESSEVCYKIGDLGLVSHAIDRLEVEEGDSRYLAVELLHEDIPKNLTKSDIFSLGLSMVELITRQELPTNGPVWHELRSGNTPHFPEVSDDLNRLIKKMLSPNPDERPSAAAIIQDPVLVPFSEKSKAQLRRELNDTKFKVELLNRQLEAVSNGHLSPSPHNRSLHDMSTPKSSGKMVRSRSLTFL